MSETNATTLPRRLAHSARTLHEATPAQRNRVVDFLRAAAILVVVLGHWTIAAVSVKDGAQVSAHAVLDQAPWTQAITWVAQVMPLFFFVGGYSNALSWRSARAKGVPYPAWLRVRLRRLAIPLIPLLLIWTAAGALALTLGVSPAALRSASQVALIPTWFLAAYVLVVAVAPGCLVLWEKYGFAAIGTGLLLAAVVDVVSIKAGNILLGYPNYLIVWSCVHMLGFAWVDGRLAGTARRLSLACVGLAGLALTVGFGPYPMSMIGVASDEISNSAPTRITMAFLGMAQIGLVLLAEGKLNNALQRPGLWLATVMVNRRIMTWYLWHITAMVTVIVISYTLLGGFGFHLEPLSATWWLSRPLWLALLLGVTAGFVAVFGRFESVSSDPRPAPSVFSAVAATVCVCAGLAVMARFGIANDQGLTWWWPLLPVLGLVVFGIVRLPGRQSRQAVQPE